MLWPSSPAPGQRSLAHWPASSLTRKVDSLRIWRPSVAATTSRRISAILPAVCRGIVSRRAGHAPHSGNGLPQLLPLRKRPVDGQRSVTHCKKKSIRGAFRHLLGTRRIGPRWEQLGFTKARTCHTTRYKFMREIVYSRTWPYSWDLYMSIVHGANFVSSRIVVPTPWREKVELSLVSTPGENLGQFALRTGFEAISHPWLNSAWPSCILPCVHGRAGKRRCGAVRRVWAGTVWVSVVECVVL